MIKEKRCRCTVCNEEIKVKGYWFNQLFLSAYHDLKFELHVFKVHKDKRINIKRFLLSVLGLMLGVIVQVIFAAIWIITLPFWAIHEFVGT